MPELSLESLSRRLTELEDQLAVYQLIASYGPAVDRADGAAAAALWLENGVYDPDNIQSFNGSAAIAALVDTEIHREYLARGCAHVASLPLVRVNGDRAVAVNHSRVYARAADVWEVVRVSANRWELIRTADGWQVERRTNRLLDGAESKREILAVD